MIARADNAPLESTTISQAEKERIQDRKHFKKEVTNRLLKEWNKKKNDELNDVQNRIIGEEVEILFQADQELIKHFSLEVCVTLSGDQIRTAIVAPSNESINALLDELEY